MTVVSTRTFGVKQVIDIVGSSSVSWVLQTVPLATIGWPYTVMSRKIVKHMDSCEVNECGPVLTFRHEYWDQVFTFHFPSELWGLSARRDDFATTRSFCAMLNFLYNVSLYCCIIT